MYEVCRISFVSLILSILNGFNILLPTSKNCELNMCRSVYICLYLYKSKSVVLPCFYLFMATTHISLFR